MSAPGRKRYCVYGCTELGAYMHNFPHPERRSELFKTWVSIVGDKLKETDPWRIYKNKRICDYHFTSDQKVASHRLMFEAVPSVNLNGLLLSAGISLLLEHNYAVPSIYQSTSSLSQPKSSEVKTEDDAATARVDTEELSAVVADTDDLSKTRLSVAALEDWSAEWLDTEEAAIDTADTEIFSWQNVPIETDDNTDNELTENVEVSENMIIDMAINCGSVELESVKHDHLFGKEGSEQSGVQSRVMLHEGFQCNACKGKIVRFRYTCVQCKDFDLCAACEARAEHDHHYVLRVPAPRPHAEAQEMVARVRSALRLGAPPEHVIVENATVKSEEEDNPWHEDWLHDPLPPCPAVATIPVTEVTSPPINQSPHKTSPKSLLKTSIQHSRPAKRKLSRYQSDTTSDDTESDDSHQALHSSEIQQISQTIYGSRMHQTVVVQKDTKRPQTESMPSPNELKEVNTKIVDQLPEKLSTERQYHPVVRKESSSMEWQENEASDFSGDDENYVPDASESARRVISVKGDGYLVRLMPIQRKRGNVVTRARSSNVTVPRNIAEMNKNTVLQNEPYIQLERVSAKELNTFLIKR